MNTLNNILDLNLESCSAFEITEEKLLLLKKEDYYTKTNFYFFLQNKVFQSSKNTNEYSYINYLISYYLMVILTPIKYEELSFNYISEALKHSDNVKYKEWALIFATLENPLLSNTEAVSIANEVVMQIPNSNIANTILMLF